MADSLVRAEVNLDAVGRNVAAVRSLLAPGTAFCAVVKADGYGHGAQAVSRAALAAGADCLAVAVVEEGLELRNAGIRAPILVLGPWTAGGAVAALHAGLDLTIYSPEAARMLSSLASSTGIRARAHVQVDTGMMRLGLDHEGAVAGTLGIIDLPWMDIPGIYSHFADADVPGSSFPAEQLARFLAVVDGLRRRGAGIGVAHMANSAAAIRMPGARLDMVRVGIALYGLRPSRSEDPGIPLEPAMTLVTQVAQIRRVRQGATVGYGRAWTAPRDSLIGTLPVGYADGWSRLLAPRATVALPGGRAPVVGRICMDHCMIDLTDLPGTEEGDRVVLFGRDGPSADDIAAAMGTINYEVVCMVGRRVPRVYRGSGPGADPTGGRG